MKPEAPVTATVDPLGMVVISSRGVPKELFCRKNCRNCGRMEREEEARYKARTRARGPMGGARALLIDAAAKAAASTSEEKATKKGACEARLETLFSSIAPPEAPSSRIASGPSGAASHEERLNDVFGGLTHSLKATAAPPSPPRGDARPAKRPTPPRRAAAPRPPKRGSRPPPPKEGYTLYELSGGEKVDASTERAAALDFLAELRRRKNKDPSDEEPPPTEGEKKPTFRKRSRPAGSSLPKKRRAANVALSHLDEDEED